MNKSFDTLVDDIYALFGEDKVAIDEEALLKYGDALMEIKKSRLNRDVRVDGELFMSNIGRPDRQVWYDINWKGETEPLLPHMYIKFLYGDLLEQMVLFLAKAAGHEVQDEQERVEVDGIRGKIDCVIDGVLVDVKSASTYSFKKFADGSLFEPGNDPFGYVAQLAGYVKAYERLHDKRTEGAFLAVDKTLGKICTLKIPYETLDQYDVEGRIKHVKEMVQLPEPPEKCYPTKPEGKSGNFVLATGCSYCRHKFHCWADANEGAGLQVYSYSSGPKFFTHVEKEPRVSQAEVEPF
jgi:hypothetical protein